MLIFMPLDAPRVDIEIVKEKLKSLNCIPHEIPGERKLAIGITGPTNRLKEEDFYLLPSVQEVVRVTQKYKLVSRTMKEKSTIIDFGNATIGNCELGIIAGPCAVESRQQMFDIAGELVEMGIKFIRGGAYKPRSSPYSFQGLKEKGLEILADVKKEFGVNIVTELLNQNTVDAVAEVADIIQIGARNMQNFTLLEDAGKTGKTILLKRGLSATVEDWLLSAEYIVSQNNYNIILCERGIRTFENSTRNTLDLNAVPVLKSETHLPVLVDPSHGIGIRDKVSSMALASIAAGADGVMVEVHTDPCKALSDGHQTLDMKMFKDLLQKIKDLAPIVDRRAELL